MVTTKKFEIKKIKTGIIRMSNNNPNLSSEIKPNLEEMGLVEISPSTVRK